MEGFEKRKALTMASMASTSLDKSPKGTIDAPIKPLLDTINKHPCYFTTSSCSGRISIFSHPPNKPKGGAWLFISHEPVEPNSVLTLLFPTESTQPELSTHNLVFRFEPVIIAVECKDVGSAQNLISLAISCGFRESGITSVSNKRVIVAIRCSIRLEVPLGCRKEIMVSRDYLRYLVGIANEKMEANWKRTQGFLEGLKKNGFVGFEGLVEVGNGLDCDEEEDVCTNDNPERDNLAMDYGPVGSHCSGSAVTPIRIVGAPMERLFLWGHSSCTISIADRKKILLYGGFGGIGRHARRDDCLLFDPMSGEVVTLNAKGSPCPRVGHTSSLIGDLMFVIGGRADPANILDDIWVLNIPKAEWKLMHCGGDVFAPRHRHASAVVDSKIYVFGGLKNDTLYSSLLVLDVEELQWKEVHASGEWPCARHSHSLAAHGFKLYLFGGYNGERALGDLYSFDVHKCQWSKVNPAGKSPYARFSHSMFVYKDYLGIIGGCPVRQHCQELSLLDLRNLLWKHVILDSVGKELFVRSTANVVDDNLVTIGGGAACYAFGTRFSEPTRINLLPVVLGNASLPSLVDEQKSMPRYEHSAEENNTAENGTSESSKLDPNMNLDGKAISGDIGSVVKDTYWVLKLEKKYAKLAKDILKKFGWLDLSRKVHSHIDGSFIDFPITEKFCLMFSDELPKTRYTFEGLNDHVLSKTFIDSHSMALDFLVSCGATKHVDEFVTMKKGAMSPLEVMREDVALLLKREGLSPSLLEQLPKRWERLGDIVVLPSTCCNDPAWDAIESELWSTVAKALGAHRLARQDRIASNGTRDSRLKILVGDNGWVEHRENGIVFRFDATKCMFSWGNLSEKLRMARLDCRGEVIVDLFAGIGYFTLPFLVRSQAKLVYACEWNPFAVEALRHNLEANSVSDSCIVLEGDNRVTAPMEVADRVCLGLLPSSEGSWVTAVRALRREGGTLHIHGNVKDSEETQWKEHVVKSICEIATSEGRSWNVTMVHLERVKWYAPHIRHVVADVKCTMRCNNELRMSEIGIGHGS